MFLICMYFSVSVQISLHSIGIAFKYTCTCICWECKFLLYKLKKTGTKLLSFYLLYYKLQQIIEQGTLEGDFFFQLYFSGQALLCTW